MTRQLELLSQLGSEPLQVPGQERHNFFVCERYAALVERAREGGFGRVGIAGYMTEQGLAMLMWRGGQAFLVAKGGYEVPAGENAVTVLRSFTADVARVLGPGEEPAL